MKAIELEAFQSIKERTRIPFERLTLLYGPNSAGKSAVSDAIGIFRDFWSGNLPSRLEDVRRWTHIPKDSPQGLESCRIAASFGNNLIVSTNSDSKSEHTLSSYEIWNRKGATLPFASQRRYRRPVAEELGEITVALSFDGWAGTVSELEIFAGQAELFRITHNRSRRERLIGYLKIEGSLQLNLAHWMFRRVGIRAADWRKNLPGSSSLESGTFGVFGNTLSLPLERPGRFETPSDLERIHLVLPEVSSPLRERAVNLFDWIKSWLTVDLVRSLSAARYSSHVPATRPIPTQSDLVFLLEGASLEEDSEEAWIEPRRTDDRVAELIASRIDEAPAFEPYKRLAQHHAYLVLARTAAESIRRKVEIFDDPDKPTWIGANLEFVNSALSGHLFIDSGYRIDIEMRHLAPTDELQHALSGNYNPYLFLMSPILATISLVDSHGRRVRFSDVGSGISNILPVLVSIASSPFVSIEQPELHLHPALQSAFGDVLIEGSRRSTLIVETHSEQVILRLLRRIRETNAGLHEADGLALRADQVAVMYFEPCADGTTKCHRLNISPHGEFYDRWPRGFFGERYVDLFDE